MFLVGICTNCNQTDLYIEAQKYGDIVMFNFMDSSDNLTVKTLVTLDWAQRYYRSQYFFNVDDDMFVKLKLILIILKKCVQHDKVIIGDCNMKAPPDGKKTSKYYVTHEMYSPEYFPTFCDGTGYIISIPAIQSILPYSGTTPVTRLEDVSLGILAKRAGNVHRL